MKKLLFAIFATAIISTLITSCGKYEEGPKFSLASKKSRLCGDWTIEKATYDDTTDLTPLLAGMTLDIEKDGGYKMQLGAQKQEGKWELGEDKDDVTFTPQDTTGGAKEETFRILRLKSKEMKLRSTDVQGKYTVYEYKQ